MAYGQRAAGTHPTGMHSCILLTYTSIRLKQNKTVGCIPATAVPPIDVSSRGFPTWGNYIQTEGGFHVAIPPAMTDVSENITVYCSG